MGNGNSQQTERLQLQVNNDMYKPPVAQRTTISRQFHNDNEDIETAYYDEADEEDNDKLSNKPWQNVQNFRVQKTLSVKMPDFALSNISTGAIRKNVQVDTVGERIKKLQQRPNTQQTQIISRSGAVKRRSEEIKTPVYDEDEDETNGNVKAVVSGPLKLCKAPLSLRYDEEVVDPVPVKKTKVTKPPPRAAPVQVRNRLFISTQQNIFLLKTLLIFAIYMYINRTIKVISPLPVYR